MDVNRFRQQHVEILKCIHRMRQHVEVGIAENAPKISHEILMLRSKVLLHLALEDDILYPRVAAGSHGEAAAVAKAYQEEMRGLAEAFKGFVAKWGAVTSVRSDPDGFRTAANTVLKALHHRIQRENTTFYPMLESLTEVSANVKLTE